jgi:hypothetical protein
MRGANLDDRLDAVADYYRLGPSERTRLRSAAEAFLGSEIAERMRAAGRSDTEVPIYVPLNETSLVGSLDAIAWENGRLLIVDYKTGASPAERPDRAEDHALQAQCYALAGLAGGATAVEVTFAFVEHPGVVETHTFEASDAAGLRKRVLEIADSMHATPTHLVSYDPGVCDGCPALGGLCPIKQPRRR